jgi:hypothetical protein
MPSVECWRGRHVGDIYSRHICVMICQEAGDGGDADTSAALG